MRSEELLSVKQSQDTASTLAGRGEKNSVGHFFKSD